MGHAVILILHNLRSNYNVGAIFRTAEAVGVKKIYLTGYTPAPTDRFGRVNQGIAKTALGAENLVPWELFARISPLLRKLRTGSRPGRLAAGYKLVALEQSPRSIDYRKVKIRGPTAIVLGNEVRGLSKNILRHCDLVAEIPMRGKKESLNVAVAGSIFLFNLLGH